MEQFIAELDAYIRWYNETRIKMSLGGRSPIEYRQDLALQRKNCPRKAPHPLCVPLGQVSSDA